MPPLASLSEHALTTELLLIFILLAFAAEILGTIGGFGSSLFFVPVAGFFFDFHTVLGITALFHVSSNIVKIIFFRKGFDKKIVLFIGVPAVLFVIAGAWLSKLIDTTVLEISLGLFLIVVSLLFLLLKNPVLKPTIANSIGGGIFSGFAAGLLGTGGAIRGITLASYNLKMEVFIATSAIIDLGIDSSRSVVYWLNGYIHPQELYIIPLLLVASIAGTYTGKKILSHVSEQQFKSFVLLMVLATGVITVVKFVW